MTNEELKKMKYRVCCPLCDNDKCMKGTDKCEAEKWEKGMTKEQAISNLKRAKCVPYKKETLEMAIGALEGSKAFMKVTFDRDQLQELVEEAKKEIQMEIKALKQEPPKATWEGVEYDGYADGCPVYDVWECTQCGYEHYGESDTLTDYCPGCGAKMTESEDE